MPRIDSSMNHDCIGSLGSIPNEPKSTSLDGLVPVDFSAMPLWEYL